MILSASGWRKVFTESKSGEDNSSEIGTENRQLSVLIAESFCQYIKDKTKKKCPVVAVGIDTRPTGPQIAKSVIKAFAQQGIKTRYLGVSSAPEIMSYARKTDGFLYISASHNPIGHNGIKFGLNDGGVIPGSEAKLLAEDFINRCKTVNAEQHAEEILNSKENAKAYSKVIKHSPKYKEEALEAYSKFIREVISGTQKAKDQDKLFEVIKSGLRKQSLAIVCDMNGSSRCVSIDKKFLPQTGIAFLPFNDEPGKIVHEIIPEPENLVHCASKMDEYQMQGKKDALLGYMPDCDGDRGNIVYWDEKAGKAKPIAAQEVFALCVLSELAYNQWMETYLHGPKALKKMKKTAVAVNCPTSMRIDDICRKLDTKVFRAEVGEANVVNLAREKREEGYTVRILGEGSNGGNITYPSAVRDPVASIFALVKLLTIRDSISIDGKIHTGLFHLWCQKSGQEEKYRPDFTLSDVIATLPQYTTTGVSEARAVLTVKTEDKGKLKTRFQKIFENEWNENKAVLSEKYGFDSYEVVLTNGTKEVYGSRDWNNGNGGLKVLFRDSDKNPVAYIWMRPSGTEPVFRVLCDVKGAKPNEEQSLLEWETSILNKADSIGE